MDWFQSLILGIIQGLTEYLPVSSSGHLAIGQALFGLNDPDANLAFTVTVHVATVLSTCVILWKEIAWIFSDLFKWKWNEGTKYAFNILVSMIPIGIVGLFFKDQIDELFKGDLLIVGICLMVTASLLAFSYYAKPRQREKISPLHAFIIGISQAIAALPGISRSGSTIATGLLLGNKKERLAQFSFLMVIPPILGEALLDTKEIAEKGVSVAMGGLSPIALIIGFLASFIVGCIACKWMINVVKRGKLIWFAAYCVAAGLLAILLNFAL
jgi:undecaprenyl-diphosphatase